MVNECISPGPIAKATSSLLCYILYLMSEIKFCFMVHEGVWGMGIAGSLCQAQSSDALPCLEAIPTCCMQPGQWLPHENKHRHPRNKIWHVEALISSKQMPQTCIHSPSVQVHHHHLYHLVGHPGPKRKEKCLRRRHLAQPPVHVS